MLSDEHAEPEWTATPARSSPISTGSASTPCTPRQTRWGSLASACGGPDDLDPLDLQRGVEDGTDLPARRRRFRLHAVGRQRRRGGAEGEQGGERLEPGAAPALLFAAHQEGLEPAPAPDDQRTGARDAAEFVRADADQVGVERAQVGRDVAAGRGGVDVDRDAGVPAQRDHLVDGLEGPHLVVAPLAVDQGRARPGSAPAGARAGRRRRAGPHRPPRASSVGASRADASRTAECSTAAQSTGAPGAARVAPQTAALMASVAPEVKTTWRPATPTSSATCAAGRLERIADGATLLVHPTGVTRREAGPLRQRGDRLGPWRCRAGVIEVGASHRWLRQRRCRRRRPAPARR